MKLLIADDQMSLHTYLDKIMDWSSLGITEVQHAYNGQEAAELADSFKPDLLIIDIRMPELNGIDALRRIQSLPRKLKTIILSAYDEFEYARDALRLNVAHYLLKPVDSQLLLDTIRELIRDIQSELHATVEGELRKVAYSGSFSESSLDLVREAFKTYGIAGYALATVNGKLPAGLSREFNARESDSRIPYSFLLREGSGEYILLLAMTEELSFEEWHAWCERQAQAWREVQPEWTAAIGISRIEQQLSKLPQRMIESINAAKLSFYSTEAVLRYDESPLAEDRQLWKIRELEKAFEEKVKGGYSPDAIGSSLNELLSELCVNRASPELAFEICHRLLFVISRAWNGKGTEEAQSVGSVYELSSTFQKFNELKLYMNEQLNACLSGSKGCSFKVAEVISRIKSYIDAYCEADLSLQTVADRFDIDKYRLSREFKLQYDENYWQYVTRIRMEQAAVYLKETNWRSSHIAERTGYVDESHFSRAFKKHYGISPKDYRAVRDETRHS